MFFVHHITHAKSFRECFDQCCWHEPAIVVVPVWRVYNLAQNEKLCKIKTIGAKRCGYSRAGYREGYRNLPIKKVINTHRALGRLDVNFYGQILKVNLYA